jgi:hypothetical protein
MDCTNGQADAADFINQALEHERSAIHFVIELDVDRSRVELEFRTQQHPASTIWPGALPSARQERPHTSGLPPIHRTLKISSGQNPQLRRQPLLPSSAS